MKRVDSRGGRGREGSEGVGRKTRNEILSSWSFHGGRLNSGISLPRVYRPEGEGEEREKDGDKEREREERKTRR